MRTRVTLDDDAEQMVRARLEQPSAADFARIPGLWWVRPAVEAS